MKKLLIAGLVVSLVLSLVASPVFAAKGDNPANDNPNNLYLYEKDAIWDIVWDGAWGKLNYKLEGTTISGVFNGHGLVAGEDYTLIEYQDPWPGVGSTVIGNATADEFGNVHIQGSVDLGTDGDSTWNQSGSAGDGYKIWLVLSADLSGSALSAWNPSEYLFEHNLIP